MKGNSYIGIFIIFKESERIPHILGVTIIIILTIYK